VGARRFLAAHVCHVTYDNDPPPSALEVAAVLFIVALLGAAAVVGLAQYIN
jgi:hypothetical protein